MYIVRQTDRQEDKAVRRGQWSLLAELECGLQPISTHCTPLLEKGGGAEREHYQSEGEQALQSQVQLTS